MKKTTTKTTRKVREPKTQGYLNFKEFSRTKGVKTSTKIIAEWEAMTEEEKNEYDVIETTEDSETYDSEISHTGSLDSEEKPNIKSPKKSPKKFKIPLGGNKPVQCSVCFEETVHIVKCPFCFISTDKKDLKADKTPKVAPKADKISPKVACIECTQEYLLTRKTLGCMSCNHEWGRSFFNDTFSEKFRTGEYAAAHKKILLDEQIAALPATLPLLEAKKKEDSLRNEITELEKLLREKEREAKEMKNQIAVNKDIIKNGVAIGVKKAYMFRCPSLVETVKQVSVPVVDKGDKKKRGKRGVADIPVNDRAVHDAREQCRGFIEQESHACTLCKTAICKKCHVILPVSADKSVAEHLCKPEDVETANSILKDTKPCPTCSSRIFKTEGCDQMFCTQCQTAFSWKTGKIETGIIHNPHFYELQQRMGNNQRVRGDVVCGGLVQIYQFGTVRHYVQPEDYARLENIHRRCAEIGQYIRDRNAELANVRATGEAAMNLESVRLAYLEGKLTMEQFRDAVYEKSRLIEKRKDELLILSTFETSIIERLRNLREETESIELRKVNRQDFEKQHGKQVIFERMTVVQLKQICVLNKIETKGLKNDIIKRLKETKVKLKMPAENEESDSNEDEEKPKEKSKKVAEKLVAEPVVRKTATKRKPHKRGTVRASVNKAKSKSPLASATMALPAWKKKELVVKEFEKLFKETDEIISFCNEAFEKNFKMLGYVDYPKIDLKTEYIFEVTVAKPVVVHDPHHGHPHRHHRPHDHGDGLPRPLDILGNLFNRMHNILNDDSED